MDTLNRKLQRTVNDKRYSIALEYTGAISQQYVLRFNGAFVSSSVTLNQALLEAIVHSDARGFNLLGAKA